MIVADVTMVTPAMATWSRLACHQSCDVLSILVLVANLWKCTFAVLQHRFIILPQHWKVKPWIDSEKISDLRMMCSERTLLSHCLYLDSPMWSVTPWMWSVIPSLSDVWLRRGMGGGPGMRWGWIEEGLPTFWGGWGGEEHQRGVWDDPERPLGTMVIVTRVSVSCEAFICSSVHRIICKFCPC